MSDLVAEMKARAQQFMHSPEWRYRFESFDDKAEMMAAFAAKEVERATEAERLENAKALCEYCGGNGLFGQDVQAAKRDKNGIWWHYTGRPDCKIQCLAAPIWERAHGKGKEKSCK